MKAMVLREFGGPDVLRWEVVFTPTPGPEEVVVRVHAESVNRTLDLQVRQDGGGYGTVLPHVLGNDPSGVVVAVCHGGEQWEVDERLTWLLRDRCGPCLVQTGLLLSATDDSGCALLGRRLCRIPAPAGSQLRASSPLVSPLPRPR